MIAQGNALGTGVNVEVSPERAALGHWIVVPFQGDRVLALTTPRAMPWPNMFSPFGAVRRTDSRVIASESHV